MENKIPKEVWLAIAGMAIKGLEVLKERVQKRGLILKFRSTTDQRIAELEQKVVEHGETIEKMAKLLAAQASEDSSLIARAIDDVQASEEDPLKGPLTA
jgi:uncharacterized coiled-coil protein SlyX